MEIAKWLGDSERIHKELALKDQEIIKLQKENAEIKERLSKVEKFLMKK